MSSSEGQRPIEQSSEMLTKTQKVTLEPAITATADDYRLSLQFWVKRLLHGNEEGIQINMEYTGSHETLYKLAHRADKANFSSKSDPNNPRFCSTSLQPTRRYRVKFMNQFVHNLRPKPSQN